MIVFLCILIGGFIGFAIGAFINIENELNEYSEKLDDWNRELREICGDKDERK